MDSEATLENLKSQIKTFCSERDWDQFHPPKDLAIGISTEANELLDLFRFKTDSEIEQKFSDLEFKNKVKHELADVFFFILRFAQKNNIDLSSALKEKMQLNADKYPVEKSKGSNKKYNE
ncbi:nucleotide pyrophosphohydrolase [Pseudobdellovibrio sp. HCB154]|uniref:nucleotide pyrophosphohydrolase n=1 Tax=Pseudobdellovibrio sp. HCB154 TaxID=3386277 RepID=UPI003916F202